MSQRKNLIINIVYQFDFPVKQKTSTTESTSWWGKRRRRSIEDRYEYDDDDAIYALLALSENDQQSENHNDDDKYDDTSEKEEDYQRRNEEGSGIDIDTTVNIEKTAMTTKNILELGKDSLGNTENIDGNMRTKHVTSNSGVMEGLEPCTNYGLEVIAVYSNNATAVSEQKRFSTACDKGAPCDEEEWQETFEIVQQAMGHSLEISATWRGCQNDNFLVVLSCDNGVNSCKEQSGPGNYRSGKFETVMTNLTYCTPYKIVLSKQSTSIQREFVSIQNLNISLNLSDISIEMNSVKYGQYPSLTEGTVTATWTHSHACISTYGVKLCKGEQCGESFQPAGNVGEKMELDLHQIPGILRLSHCQQYQLYIMPGTRRREDAWHAGHVTQFTYIPGYDPPRNPADFGSNDESVADIVMFVGQESVDLEWRPPNKCVQGHDIKVVAIRHLPHIRPELISSEVEPVVFHRQVNQSFLTADDAELSISSNLSSCQLYRVEISSVYHDLHQGQIISEPLVQYFKTKPGNKVTTPYMDKEVVPNKPAGISQTIFQFVDRCADKYFLSICLFPDHCEKAQYATYTITQDEEKSSRGYYEQAVPALLPCSVFKWEVMAGGNNFSLFREYLFTEPDMDQFQFRLANLRTNVKEGSVELSWTLTQPCIDEYQIQLCHHTNTSCWAGNFSRPEVESDKDFNIDIDLQLLDGFNFTFDDCENYELIIIPSVNQGLLDTRIKVPFTYIINPKPPVKLNVSETTESSFLVSWTNSDCSKGTELVILKEGAVVEEYILGEGINEYLVDKLDRCSDYVIELFGANDNIRSNESQIMLAITENGDNIPFNLKSHALDIQVIFKQNMSKCVSEYIVEICEVIGEECNSEYNTNCTTVVLKSNQLSHIFTNMTESTVYSVTVTGIDHHNQTTFKSEVLCSRTSSEDEILLDVVQITENNFTLLLNLDEIKAEEEIDVSLLEAFVMCKEHTKEHTYERTGFDTQFTFTHLEPNTDYECSGFAKVNDEKIDISDTVVHTLDAVPDKLGSVSLSEVTTEGFLISWSMPDNIKGELESYKITLTSSCENTNMTDCETTLGSNHTCQYSENITISGNSTSYRHSAVPGTKYFAQISAKTRNPKLGPPSDVQSTVTMSVKPHKPEILRVQKSMTGSVLIEYDYPCPHTGPTHFDIHYYCNFSDCNADQAQKTEKLARGNRFFEVKGLPSGFEYSFRVEAIVDNCIDDSQNIVESDDNDEIIFDYAHDYISLEQCSIFSSPLSLVLECDHRCADGTCVNRGHPVECNWVAECPDGSDEWNCTCSGFSCGNNFCIPDSQRCDGIVQCNDATDEYGCGVCNKDQFMCARSGRCIPGEKACDKILDCWDGSDEKNCPYRKHICWPNKFKCFDGRCIAASKRCDRVADCAEGEDEQNCEFQCGLDEFTCKDGGCIKQRNVCDDTLDCDDGSDEPEHCHCFMLGEFACRASGHCMKRHKVCDGAADCPDKSDEEGCEKKLPRTPYKSQSILTDTTDFEEPRNDQWSKAENPPSKPTKSTQSFDRYPDFPITYLQPMLNGKLSHKGLTSYSQIKSTSITQYQGNHKLNNLDQSLHIERMSDKTKEDRYAARQQSMYPQPASLTSRGMSHITTYDTTMPSTTQHWESLVSVQTYPLSQTLLVGYDAVLQCRDEGQLRREVFWQRGGGRQLPSHATQQRGRLEILGVTIEDEGEYECVALGYEHQDGGRQISSLWIQE